MQTLKPNKSVLSSASNIFESMIKSGVKPDPEMKKGMPYIPPAQVKVPDISKVSVPDAMLESIFTSMGHKQETKSEEVIQIYGQPVEKEILAEAKLNGIVSKLTSLIKEAKTVLEEICSSGAIGVSQKKQLKKVNGPTKTNKRN